MKPAISAVALFLFLGGCASPPITSQVPIPAAYPISTQQQMQAARHWMELAQDVAAEMKQRIEDYRGNEQTALYICPSGISPFQKAMYDLLVTEFVKSGIRVSNNDQESLVLNFDIQVIRHPRRVINTSAGVYKSLAPGFFVRRDTPLVGGNRVKSENDVKGAELYTEAGLYTVNVPKNEIIFTSSLLNENDYIFRHSSSYYINDSEKWLYQLDISNQRPSITSYRLVDR
ncbi:MAG: hypothetical protein V2B19_21265 [Pseudomonadota bacterium]